MDFSPPLRHPSHSRRAIDKGGEKVATFPLPFQFRELGDKFTDFQVFRQLSDTGIIKYASCESQSVRSDAPRSKCEELSGSHGAHGHGGRMRQGCLFDKANIESIKEL